LLRHLEHLARRSPGIETATFQLPDNCSYLLSYCLTPAYILYILDDLCSLGDTVDKNISHRKEQDLGVGGAQIFSAGSPTNTQMKLDGPAHGILLITFVSSGRLPEAAGDQIPGEAQRAVGASIDVLHQHVNAGVLALRSQLQQLVKSLEEDGIP